MRWARKYVGQLLNLSFVSIQFPSNEATFTIYRYTWERPMMDNEC
jgi:hypothetical protein